MSNATATEIEPAKPRAPSRVARKRDERTRRLVRWLKRDATFLDKPRYGPMLRIYAGLTLKYETLLANINAKYGDNLLDELGNAIPPLETLQRLAKACATIGSQLGLSPGAERAMRHGSGIDPDNPWLALANRKHDEEVILPAAPASAPAPSSAPEPTATNGTPASDRAVQGDVDGTSMPGFTAPA